jgi:hypothetical protein
LGHVVILPAIRLQGGDVVVLRPAKTRKRQPAGFIARLTTGTRTARCVIDGADVLIYGTRRPLQVNPAMMYLGRPPLLIETKVFSAMPERFRRKGVRSTWADANRPGLETDCFIEGPSFDADSHLYIVDIPFRRIFRIAPNGDLIARIKSCAGQSCTNVAIGGAHRDRLYITESATGTVLVADIGVLDDA